MSRIISLAAAASLLIMLGVAWELRGIHSAVDVLIETGRTNMQTLTTTWTSGGISRTITTTRTAGETTSAFIARHAEVEAEAFKHWPKDPQ